MNGNRGKPRVTCQIYFQCRRDSPKKPKKIMRLLWDSNPQPQLHTVKVNQRRRAVRYHCAKDWNGG